MAKVIKYVQPAWHKKLIDLLTELMNELWDMIPEAEDYMLSHLLNRALNISNQISTAIAHLLNDEVQRPALLEQVRTIESRCRVAIDKIKIRMAENDNDLLLKESLFGYPVNVSKQIQHVMSAAQKQEITVDKAVNIIRKLYADHQAKYKPAVEKITTFEEWFHNPQDIESCMQALRDADVINNENVFLLGPQQKVPITAWVYILFKKNYIKRQGDDTTAPLLSQKIKNFTTTGKTLSKRTGKNYGEYYKQFSVLIEPRK